MSDAPFENMLVTPDFIGATTDEEFRQRYIEANPWAAEQLSAEDEPTAE
mgnify:CR=1 FL=1